ncbi:hypothetical protein [Spirochaeta cellobiosiphila]|uniref:hypothetical protein n=1 Tax=Spirochaeta cellobiosiphila TaxID=504483 RepID=UPI000414350D|nr:hypothetical protein [Spirochaeta cellobiosiphila]
MKLNHLFKPFPILLLFITSCIPLPSATALMNWDTKPAELLTWNLKDRKMMLSFDEAISQGDFNLDQLKVDSMEIEGDTITLTLPGNRGADKLTGTVNDQNDNETFFILPFYYSNPNLPNIIINEFTTKGSKTHPDMVEFYCLTSGNIESLTFYIGVKSNYTNRYIFPSLEVKAGDYILLHLKPEGIEGEINEYTSQSESIGIDHCDTAWDLWVDEATGLSANNGILALYNNPNGNILDGVYYTNRSSENMDKYSGFGSKKTLEQANILYKNEQWEFDSLSPDYGIRSTNSTSTRSICRSSDFIDTNGTGDWHIVPTRGSTFGYKNTDDSYN